MKRLSKRMLRRMKYIVLGVLIISIIGGIIGAYGESLLVPPSDGDGQDGVFVRDPLDGYSFSYENDEDYEPYALYITNILRAENGLGTWRYTLALPTDEPLDESDYQYAALGGLSRRLIDLDGALADPLDANVLGDIAATKGLQYGDVYAVFVVDSQIFIYKNGEELVFEELSNYYTDIIYTRNARGIPALRYTRKNGKTALIPFAQQAVILFTGDYLKLTIASGLNDMAVALGSACQIEMLSVNSDIILHNSGMVLESTYAPTGIRMVGIIYDEDENPVTLDSGMQVTGPRPVTGRWCEVCKTEYSGRKERQVEWHLIHVCESADCAYGGYWASCAPEESDLYVANHAAAPWCPYRLCRVCSNELCRLCTLDRAARGE
ncbi:hypothetical protein FACS18948_1640 [Clostridia bacterium]|nr:hypothetical protein FACS18948_1640 [Clostridia bacterium]